MQVTNSSQNKINFTARNIEIRKLDDLMRYTNLQFPRISYTKIVDRIQDLYSTSPKFKEKKSLHLQLKEFISNTHSKMLALRSVRVVQDKSYLQYLKDTIAQIKLEKLGNCGESASLALAVLKANGYENVQKVGLCCYLKTSRLRNSLDHAFVVVNLDKNADLSNPKTYGKKAVVVDAWNGFADYAENAFRRFESEYDIPVFKKPFSEGKKHGFRLGCFLDNQALSSDDVKKLVESNPFLVKKNLC